MASPLPTSTLRRALRQRLVAWYRVHRRDLPWRRTRDPYAIWVSEAMLQQTRVEAVEGYWVRFMRRFPDVQALAEAPEEDVLAAWSGLGYYRRARALHEAAKVIQRVHGGEFPRTRDALRALPGVGPYTAGAILSIAFDVPEALVDGNVERVFARLFELPGARASRELGDACWRLAEALMPPSLGEGTLAAKSAAARAKQRAASPGAPATSGASSALAPPTPSEWNQGLMELGATLCTPKSPACGVCPLTQLCAGRASGRAAELPPQKATPAPVDVALEAYLAPAEVVAGARTAYWLERRAAGGRMAGLWQLPTVEVRPAERAEVYLFPEDLPEAPGFALEPERELFVLRHAITHHRIRVRVRAARVIGAPPATWRAFTQEEALAAPLSGMARKALARLDSSRGALFVDGETA
ncbi:MAG: A/G-specific adenine glycosylase [Planctomycetota bacterium]